MEQVLSIAIFLGFGLGFVLVNLLVGALVRPSLPNSEKVAIYECGEPTIGTSWVQFDLRFYIVALFYLVFDVEVTISRPRRFWFDATLLDTTLRRELTYHAVTDRYVLREESGSGQESFATLGEALDRIGHIEDLPILVQSQLGPGPWECAVRAGVGRGRMPEVLRALVFWSGDWHRTSDWYTWMLTL